MHLSECITREKAYMVSNLYLKFTELQLLEGDDKPFGNLYGAASSTVLAEFLSPHPGQGHLSVPFHPRSD